MVTEKEISECGWLESGLQAGIMSVAGRDETRGAHDRLNSHYIGQGPATPEARQVSLDHDLVGHRLRASNLKNTFSELFYLYQETLISSSVLTCASGSSDRNPVIAEGQMQRQSRPTLGPKSMGPPVERRAREGPQHIGCFHACRNPVVSGPNHDYRIVEGRL